MLIPFIVGLIAVILTCLTQSRQNGSGLKAAFVIIFVFLALRYDYGNDYMAYLKGFKYATSSFVRVDDVKWEPGWVLLNRVFKPFGFFTMVMFLSLVNCVVIYRFIRNFVPAQYQWLGVFLYVFDPYLLLVPASAMRQNLGILLFLVGIEFLYKKRFLVYFLLITVGWSFHQSAKVMILVAPLAFVNIKINKFVAVLCVCIYASLYLYGEPVIALINSMTGVLFEKYNQFYVGGKGMTLNTGIGLAYAIFMFMGILYFAGVEFSRFGGGKYEGVLPGQAESFPSLAARRLLFKLAIVSFMLTPLGFQLAIISRMNMYFATVMIAVYPIIAITTRKESYKLMLLGSLIPFTLYKFVMFFYSPVWKAKFGTYQTIFSSQNWW